MRIQGGIKMMLWPLKVILTSIHKRAALLCSGELSEESEKDEKAHREEQAATGKAPNGEAVIPRIQKRQVLQYPACSD